MASGFSLPVDFFFSVFTCALFDFLVTPSQHRLHIVRRFCGCTLSEDSVVAHCQKILWLHIVRRFCGCTLSEDPVVAHCQKILWLHIVRRSCGCTLSEDPVVGNGRLDSVRTCVVHNCS